MKKTELYGISELGSYDWPDNFFGSKEEAINNFIKDVPSKFKTDLAELIKGNRSDSFVIKTISELEKEYEHRSNLLVDFDLYKDNNFLETKYEDHLSVWERNEFQSLCEKLYEYFRSNNINEELYQFSHKLLFKLSKRL